MQPKREFQRAVVTGGAGFLGSHLSDALLASGCEVICVDNLCTGSRDNMRHLLDDPRFTFVLADVSAGLHVEGPVDLVLHLASPASPVAYTELAIETLEVGSRGTSNALELAAEKGARFILASTSEVYGDPLESPQSEVYRGNVNPVGERSMYDEAKRFGEALTVAHATRRGVDAGIVRIFNTYGPRLRSGDGRVIPNFIRQALVDDPMTVYGDGTQTRSLCYVDDTVRGILDLAASHHLGPVNIGNPEEITITELAERIRGLIGSSSPLRHLDLPADDPKRRCPDILRAGTLLGWKPTVSLNDGLLRTISWFEENQETPDEGPPVAESLSQGLKERTGP
ncbi:UDP-glucuronic acid decarboxylase family protein [Streptomyces sp. NPDC059002]|uniref:UDP-glucuronic acid decarboxylase family protein n=1 Tax=Streptomyces sp. NPDC059002 TaxID=3346690 RepID=UPI00367E35FF